MAGTRTMTAEKLLGRLKKLKAYIDKGGETSITSAANKYLKSSHFVKALLKHDVVHTNKHGFARWNGLAVNLKLAQTIIDDAHKYNKAYWVRKRKTNKETSPPSSAVEPEDTQTKISQTGDVNTILDKKTLDRIAKVLGIGDKSDMDELRTAISAVSEDMVRIKAFLFDLHMDHKERMIESITQQMGVQT